MRSENFQARLKSVYSVFIVVATCIICKFLFSFLRVFFIPGYPYNFRYLVIIFFNFTIYDIIYIYIYIYKKKNFFNPLISNVTPLFLLSHLFEQKFLIPPNTTTFGKAASQPPSAPLCEVGAVRTMLK